MLKKRLNNKKGFTLAELLIAVAIIGILVAISVPVFTGKLADAKKATDNANIRAAKAAGVVKSLEGDLGTGTTKDYYYNAETGQLEETNTSIKGYGQSTDTLNQIIKVTITKATGAVTISWSAAGVQGS